MQTYVGNLLEKVLPRRRDSISAQLSLLSQMSIGELSRWLEQLCRPWMRAPAVSQDSLLRSHVAASVGSCSRLLLEVQFQSNKRTRFLEIRQPYQKVSGLFYWIEFALDMREVRSSTDSLSHMVEREYPATTIIADVTQTQPKQMDIA